MALFTEVFQSNIFCFLQFFINTKFSLHARLPPTSVSISENFTQSEKEKKKGTWAGRMSCCLWSDYKHFVQIVAQMFSSAILILTEVQLKEEQNNLFTLLLMVTTFGCNAGHRMRKKKKKWFIEWLGIIPSISVILLGSLVRWQRGPGYWPLYEATLRNQWVDGKLWKERRWKILWRIEWNGRVIVSPIVQLLMGCKR